MYRYKERSSLELSPDGIRGRAANAPIEFDESMLDEDEFEDAVGGVQRMEQVRVKRSRRYFDDF